MGKKKSVFSGVGTAIVTPFSDGDIDYQALGGLIDFQINNGADAIILLGTTGEASVINEKEREECITFAKNRIKKRIPLIVGTGSNNTEVTLRYSKMAERLGADAILVVTPYYNKASNNGLVLHYKEVAKSVALPIILYNVPSRTGVNIPMEVYGKLSETDNIVGIKEASGNLSYVSEIIAKYGNYYDIYSGNDDIALPVLAMGGKGVVSVVSNIVPSYVHQLCHEFFHGNIGKSAEIQLYLTELIKEMFAEVNPIPIKTALYRMNMCKEEFRLPMCRSTRVSEIDKILKKYLLI